MKQSLTKEITLTKQVSGRDRIKGIIFDLDGTLLNTLESLANSHNRMLQILGYPSHDIDAYRYFVGDGARRCVARCLPVEAQVKHIIDHALEVQQKDYQSNWHRDVEVYPGIKRVLKQLLTQAIPIAVLSNKDHQFTAQCVNHFFPDTAFSEIRGHAPGTPYKPDPRGAMTIAADLEIHPQDLALIGDTAMDMQTAVACHMYAVGALWGFRERQELLDAGADCLLSEPCGILKLFT